MDVHCRLGYDYPFCVVWWVVIVWPRINASVTLTICLGWFAIPDLPHHKSARFLNEEEKEFAVRRLGESRKTTWDLTVFRRVLLSWQFWLLPTVFMRELPRMPPKSKKSLVTNSWQSTPCVFSH